MSPEDAFHVSAATGQSFGSMFMLCGGDFFRSCLRICLSPHIRCHISMANNYNVCKCKSIYTPYPLCYNRAAFIGRQARWIPSVCGEPERTPHGNEHYQHRDKLAEDPSVCGEPESNPHGNEHNIHRKNSTVNRETDTKPIIITIVRTARMIRSV